MAALPKETLRTIFATLAGLPVEYVIWEGEPQPFSNGHITVDVLSLRPFGWDDETREYPTPSTTKITQRGHRGVTLSLRADMMTAQAGYDILEDVRIGLADDDVLAALNAQNLAFTGGTDIRKIPAAVDNRAISVALMDLSFNQAVEKVIEKNVAGYIETVEMAGMPDTDLEIVESFEVTDPPDA